MMGALEYDKDADSEIKEIANIEFVSLKEQVTNLERDIQFALLPKDKDDTRNAMHSKYWHSAWLLQLVVALLSNLVQDDDGDGASNRLGLIR